eukprot:TRINITY_DN7761_c0_g2_i1.p1 TRINITY_DN7761_c0_g2~~TRINITY_DN7761_c0_g2_i1.p1  ORF type:complete len:316 (+),score=50.08 TRINITY_DN7761_c0_g2_i1:56-949(+)
MNAVTANRLLYLGGNLRGVLTGLLQSCYNDATADITKIKQKSDLADRYQTEINDLGTKLGMKGKMVTIKDPVVLKEVYYAKRRQLVQLTQDDTVYNGMKKTLKAGLRFKPNSVGTFLHREVPYLPPNFDWKSSGKALLIQEGFDLKRFSQLIPTCLASDVRTIFVDTNKMDFLPDGTLTGLNTLLATRGQVERIALYKVHSAVHTVKAAKLNGVNIYGMSQQTSAASRSVELNKITPISHNSSVPVLFVIGKEGEPLQPRVQKYCKVVVSPSAAQRLPLQETAFLGAVLGRFVDPSF